MIRRQLLAAVGGTIVSGCISDGQSTPTREDNGTSTMSTSDDQEPQADNTDESDFEAEPREGTILHGIHDGIEDLQRIADYSQWTGGPPAVFVLYVAALESEEWSRHFVNEWMTEIWNHGHVPLVSWMPQPTNRDNTPLDIEQRIADGQYDAALQTWAELLAEWASAPDHPYERRFYIRPAHEMNGTWKPWSATEESGTTPDDYVEMWRRLHGVFMDTSLNPDQIQWMWCPNAGGYGDYGTTAYYPGSEYTDWLGVDGFNFGHEESWSVWESPDERMGSLVRTLQNNWDKPLALAEVATSSYRDGEYRPSEKAEWVNQFFDFLSDEEIKMFCWFNVEKNGSGESDWRIFGGEHGTDTFQVEDRTYNVYPQYADTITEPDILPAYSEHPRLLTTEEFQGDM